MTLFQVDQDNYTDPDIYKTAIIIAVILLVMGFILKLLKTILDHNLKSKMLQKDLPESTISAILQKDHNSKKHKSVKWFLILLGIGIGFLFVPRYVPLSIHSIAILALSISCSFLCYSLYLKFDEQK